MKLKEKTPASFRCSVSIVNCQDLFIGHTFFTRHDLRFGETIMCIFPNFIVFPPTVKLIKSLSVHVFQSCPIAYKNILTNVYKNMTLHPFTDRQKALIDNTNSVNMHLFMDWTLDALLIGALKLQKKISKLNVWNLKPLSHFQQEQM